MDADLAERAWSHILEVERLGGMAKAIEAGIPKLRIEEAAARTQARIDTGEQAVIGVNTFVTTHDQKIDILKVDNAAVRAKRAMISAADRAVLLVNHTRFGRSALHALADLTDFDAIITDAAPAPHDRAAIERAGLRLTIARD